MTPAVLFFSTVCKTSKNLLYCFSLLYAKRLYFMQNLGLDQTALVCLPNATTLPDPFSVTVTSVNARLLPTCST